MRGALVAHLGINKENGMYQVLSTCKSGGYVFCRTDPKHPKANSKGLYPLHRVIVENEIGMSLTGEVDVHHKNGDKTDNRPVNLEVLSKSDHTRKHVRKLAKVLLVCPNCGKVFELAPRFYRLRLKRNKTGFVFCSRSCGASV